MGDGDDDDGCATVQVTVVSVREVWVMTDDDDGQVQVTGDDDGR